MKLSTKQIQLINESIKANEFCSIGILDGQRIFCGHRKNSPELLVLISSVPYTCELWGHIFLHRKLWVSVIAKITGCFSGKDENSITKDFWLNIKTRAGWGTLGIRDNDSYVAKSNSFDEALKHLAGMIRRLNDNVLEIDNNSDIELYKVYGVAPLVKDSLYSR